MDLDDQSMMHNSFRLLQRTLWDDGDIKDVKCRKREVVCGWYYCIMVHSRYFLLQKFLTIYFNFFDTFFVCRDSCSKCLYVCK